MKIAKLVYRGTQQGFGTLPACELFNIVALGLPSDRLAIGSTVTLAKVTREGFTPLVWCEYLDRMVKK